MRLRTLLLAAMALARAFGDKQVDADSEKGTVFNSVLVPPLIELTPETFNGTVESTKFLLVKHYSPYCPHCLEFAPVFQTLYEYYYTSPPTRPDADAKDQTFSEYNDFKFATVNCVPYYDWCVAHDVQHFPTTTLYINGEPFEVLRGINTMDKLSEVIERGLEKEYPGTRPNATILLPEPGVEDFLFSTSTDPAKPGTISSDFSTSPGTAFASTPLKMAASELFNAPTVTNVNTSMNSQLFHAKGKSVSLTAESFQTLVTMRNDPWFIKFYVPWCHHCQAVAANWNQMAKVMDGALNVGEVNCDKEKRLCKDIAVQGYPTIAFFKAGERVEYHGLRGLGDFVRFAEDAIDLSAGVKDVDAASFKELEDKEDVIFVYFYDHATTSEDFMALNRLPLSLVGHAKIVKTKDPKMYDRFKISTWPRLLVSRESRPTYFTPLTPRQMRDVNGILNWMKSVWLPIVPELTAVNARELMHGKIIVLGILNRQNEDDFLTSKREIKSAATEWMDRQIQEFQLERQKLRDSKQLRIEEAEDRNDQRALRNAKNTPINMDRSDRKEVAFAWVDGVFWQRWIRSTYGVDVKNGEKIVINDEDNRRYWDLTVTGNHILVSRTSIMETLDKIVHSPQSIKSKLTISKFEKVFFDLRMCFVQYTYVAVPCVLIGAILSIHWFRRLLRRNLGGNIKLEEPITPRKEVVLGSGSNGKVD